MTSGYTNLTNIFYSRKKCCNDHTNCLEMLKELKNFMYCFSNQNVDKYIVSLTLNSSHKTPCITLNDHNIFLKTLFAKYTPSSNMLERIISVKTPYVTELFDILVKKGHKFRTDVVYSAINSKNDPLGEIVCKNADRPIDLYRFNAACINGMKKTVEAIIDRKTKPTHETMLYALAYDTNNIDIVRIIAEHVPDNVDFLKKACNTKNYEYVEFFLERGIVPNKECFAELIMRSYGRSDHRLKITSLLTKYGYHPDQADICAALANDFEIYLVPELDISIDERLLALVCEYGGANLGMMIQNIVGRGVIPTIDNLRAVCKRAHNYDALVYLVSYGIKPDLECLVNLAETNGNGSLIELTKRYREMKNDDAKKIEPKTLKRSSRSNKLSA